MLQLYATSAAPYREVPTRACGLRLMKTEGRQRAIVAVARKIAVVPHRMWADGSDFRLGPQEAAA